MWLRDMLERAYERAHSKLKVVAEKQKNRHEARLRPQKFEVGQFVWRYYSLAAKRKLGKGWVGPYKIVGIPTDTNCVIQKAMFIVTH